MYRFWDHFTSKDEYETIDKVLNHKNTYGKKALEFCLKNVNEVINETGLNKNNDWDLIIKLTAKKINKKWLYTMEREYN